MKNLKSDKYNNMEFIAMLAHDMKTPVKAQIRALNLLYSGIFGEFSDEAKNIILNIIASNKYMQRLTDNVLGDFRVNSGRFIIKKTKNDIRKTIEEAICFIGILSEVKGQKISVNYQTDNPIGTYDEVEIQRVLINILSNAFEYSKENTEIFVNVFEENNSLNVLIKNNFFHIPDKKKQPGEINCNLGLIVSDVIIKAHNGEFKTFIDKEGKYCTMFTVPR